MKYVRVPEVSIAGDAVRARVRTALTQRTAETYLDSVTDIYELLAEVENVLRREQLNRYEFADLLAAARTAFDDTNADNADDRALELRALLHLHREITAEELDAWRATEQPEPIEGRH